MHRFFKTTLGIITGLGSLAYIYQAVFIEKRSVGSKLAENLIRLFNFDLAKVDASMLRKNCEENRKDHRIHDGLMNSEVNSYSHAGMQVFRVTPTEKKSPRRVLYLHGGAYIHQPSIFHWLFIDKMVQNTGLEFIVPIYPKAPEYSYEDAYKALETFYNALLDECSDKLILMGDSAGGGLALGFSQWLASERLPMPKAMIIISPWLDITLSNPEITKYEKVDPMLEPDNLKIIGKIWAKNSDPNYYKVSPIYGSLFNLPKLYMFVGTREICFPDARKFAEMLKKQDVPYEYFEYPMMNHVFPQYPILEGAKARQEIKEILCTLN